MWVFIMKKKKKENLFGVPTKQRYWGMGGCLLGDITYLLTGLMLDVTPNVPRTLMLEG